MTGFNNIRSLFVNTKNTRYDARKTYLMDFWDEMKRQADVTMAFERTGGEYDVMINKVNTKGLSVKITTDIHGLPDYDTPHEIAKKINRHPWDIVLMRYIDINYEGIPKTFYRDTLKAKAVFFPWSLCDKRWMYSEKKKRDVVFLGTSKESMYPLRAAIKKGIGNYDVITGAFPMSVKRDKNALKKNYPGIYMGDKYIKALQKSKVMLTGASRYGCPVKKYFEAMATGCLLMADRPNHADEIGLVDGENYVEISKDNWREKLDYYLANEVERLRITRNARELFERRHTNRVRAEQLIKLLQ